MNFWDLLKLELFIHSTTSYDSNKKVSGRCGYRDLVKRRILSDLPLHSSFSVASLWHIVNLVIYSTLFQDTLIIMLKRWIKNLFVVSRMYQLHLHESRIRRWFKNHRRLLITPVVLGVGSVYKNYIRHLEVSAQSSYSLISCASSARRTYEKYIYAKKRRNYHGWWA